MAALLLSACSGTSGNFDPTDWITGEFFDTKTKLPGERKPVFPSGVPGVPEGVPPELVKGNQQPVVEAAAQPDRRRPRNRLGRPAAGRQACAEAANGQRPAAATCPVRAAPAAKPDAAGDAPAQPARRMAGSRHRPGAKTRPEHGAGRQLAGSNQHSGQLAAARPQHLFALTVVTR